MHRAASIIQFVQGFGWAFRRVLEPFCWPTIERFLAGGDVSQALATAHVSAAPQQLVATEVAVAVAGIIGWMCREETQTGVPARDLEQAGPRTQTIQPHHTLQTRGGVTQTVRRMLTACTDFTPRQGTRTCRIAWLTAAERLVKVTISAMLALEPFACRGGHTSTHSRLMRADIAAWIAQRTPEQQQCLAAVTAHLHA